MSVPTLLRVLPAAHIGRAVGLLARVPLPRPLAAATVRAFAGIYGADLTECDRPVSGYRSVADFFGRSLRPGARPVGPGLVSPVDGTLRTTGVVERDTACLVKGVSYPLDVLLAGEFPAGTFDGGRFWNFYLSPKDYHHVHAPAGGVVSATRHVPGSLWPVNDWSVSRVPSLFSLNERLVIRMDTPRGPAAVVLVAALNVGNIRVTAGGDRPADAPPPAAGVTLSAGDRLASFLLGSSVVLLVTPEAAAGDPGAAPRPVKYGESLVSG